MSGFKPFTKFQSSTEYVSNATMTVTAEFDNDADYFRMAEVAMLRRVKITLPEGKRLNPLIHRGKAVRITLMGGQYEIAGKLLWRRLNVAMVEGILTKHG